MTNISSGQWAPGHEPFDPGTARWWDERPRLNRAVARGIRKRVQLLTELGLITKQSRVLSVGCGTGHHEESLRTGQLICLDLSTDMLRHATARVNSCLRGTVYQLPFADDTFDCAFAIDVNTLHDNPQDLRVATISEMRRVVRQEGRVVTMTKSASRAMLNGIILRGNRDADPYRVANREIEKAFTENDLEIEHRLHVGYPGIRPLWGDRLLSILGAGLLGAWFICSGRK